MHDEFAIAGHWQGGFDEPALQSWAEHLRQELKAPRVTLGLVFMAPRFFPHAAQILELLRVHARIPLLVGCSSNGLIADREEFEENAGLAVGLYHLPGAQLKAFHFDQSQLDRAGQPDFWEKETGVASAECNGWLAFADPFHLDCDGWLKSWNGSYAPLPVLGGLASGNYTTQETQVYLNGEVFHEGGVAVSFGGEVALASVISQGCTPIGETWTITKADHNLIHEIGNRPAYQILADTFNELAPEEQKKSRGNLFVGLVVNEYLEEFHRGDFLVRNLLGADPRTGSLAVAALPRPGQTIQFQRRDAAAASEDMVALLETAQANLNGATIYGGCLCSCNGRGFRLFGYPNHDAGMIQRTLGPLGLTGFFCNGEIGPVSGKNFLHGYTASLALFLKKTS